MTDPLYIILRLQLQMLHQCDVYNKIYDLPQGKELLEITAARGNKTPPIVVVSKAKGFYSMLINCSKIRCGEKV